MKHSKQLLPLICIEIPNVCHKLNIFGFDNYYAGICIDINDHSFPTLVPEPRDDSKVYPTPFWLSSAPNPDFIIPMDLSRKWDARPVTDIKENHFIRVECPVDWNKDTCLKSFADDSILHFKTRVGFCGCENCII